MRISRRDLADVYGYSMRTIDRCIREIESLSGTRYPQNSVLRIPGIKVREDVAHDYMEHRQEIKDGTAPEFKWR